MLSAGPGARQVADRKGSSRQPGPALLALTTVSCFFGLADGNWGVLTPACEVPPRAGHAKQHSCDSVASYQFMIECNRTIWRGLEKKSRGALDVVVSGWGVGFAPGCDVEHSLPQPSSSKAWLLPEVPESYRRPPMAMLAAARLTKRSQWMSSQAAGQLMLTTHAAGHSWQP